MCVRPTAGSSHGWHVQRLGRGLGVAVVVAGCDCARSMCSLQWWESVVRQQRMMGTTYCFPLA